MLSIDTPGYLKFKSAMVNRQKEILNSSHFDAAISRAEIDSDVVDQTLAQLVMALIAEEPEIERVGESFMRGYCLARDVVLANVAGIHCEHFSSTGRESDYLFAKNLVDKCIKARMGGGTDGDTK